MTKAEKEKLLGTNVLIWVLGIIFAFILPMIAESISDGPARFLKVMAFAFPLIVGMLFSNGVISKALGDPTD